MNSIRHMITGFGSSLKDKMFTFGKRFMAQPSLAENNLINKLRLKFPEASVIEVKDISGGCGDMFDVYVSSLEFKDKTLLEQHTMINQILKDEIKNMHGIQIKTDSQ